MRSIDFSHSETKIPINISQDFFKSKESRPRFELLYENSSILNKKLDLMRAKNYFEKQEKMIPVISKKAQEIKRPKELFFKGLYNPKNNIIKNNNNQDNEKEYIKNNINKNKENKNNINSSSNENNKNNEKNDEEDSLYIINNKKKNEEYKKLYKSSNIKSNNINNKSIYFLFKPNIDQNSQIIASKIKVKSKDRLLSLSVNQKNNLNNILNQREEIKQRNIKAEKEKELFKLNNNTYKPNVKIKKRKEIDKLYENGINAMKKREEKTKNEKIKNENEYLKYSFSPIINHSHTYTNFFKNKNYSTNSSKINNKRNFKSNTNRNNNKNNLLYSKTTIYERNKKWKDLIEEKKK